MGRVPFSLKQSQRAANKHGTHLVLCIDMAPWWILAMTCTACACACALPSVLGENELEHLGHIVPFASSGKKEAPEHWHATRMQEAEDVFDAFATPERAEACNSRFIFPALSLAQSNASHAQASYNSNTQLCHEWSSKQPDEEQIELAEPQRVLGHTMSDAKFANLRAQVAMLTDLLRNLAPTANAAKGPFCILAIIMIAAWV